MDDMLRNDRLVISRGGRLKHTTGGREEDTNSSIVSPSRKESERVEDDENKKHVSPPQPPSQLRTKDGGEATYPLPCVDVTRRQTPSSRARLSWKNRIKVRNARPVVTSCYHYARWCSHDYNAWCEAILHHRASSLSCITAETPKKKRHKNSR